MSLSFVDIKPTTVILMSTQRKFKNNLYAIISSMPEFEAKTGTDRKWRLSGWERPLLIPAFFIRGMGYLLNPQLYSMKTREGGAGMLVGAGAIAVTELRTWKAMNRRQLLKKVLFAGMGTAIGLYINIADAYLKTTTKADQ